MQWRRFAVLNRPIAARQVTDNRAWQAFPVGRRQRALAVTSPPDASTLL